MPMILHYRWRMRSETIPGRIVVSELMTEAQAREIDPDAECLPHTETLQFERAPVDGPVDPYDPRRTG